MNKRSLGTAWEEQAAEFLKREGCEILERNFRGKRGEIDLIVRDGRYLVFGSKIQEKCGQWIPGGSSGVPQTADEQSGGTGISVEKATFRVDTLSI